MPSQNWSSFKVFRIVIFVFCILLNLGCTAGFSVLLLREWGLYDMNKRAMAVGLTVAHGIGAILLYLMLVVRFRVWLDAARISFYLLSILGGTLVFILFNSSSSCPDTEGKTLCRELTVSVTITGLVISGLMVLYAIGLGVMAHAPPPPIVLSPEDSKRLSKQSTADSFDSGTGLLLRQRSSLNTEHSFERLKGTILPMDSRKITEDLRVPASVVRAGPHPLMLDNRPRPEFSYTVTMSPRSAVSSPSPASAQDISMYPGSYEYMNLPSPYELSPSISAPPFLATFSGSDGSVSKRYHSSSSVSVDSKSIRGDQTRAQGDLQQPLVPLPSTAFITRSSSPVGMGSLNVSTYRSSIGRTSMHLLPNPFANASSRSTTPVTPSTASSDWYVGAGHYDVSLSFGQRGFPLPPSYNVTPWPQYANEYLNPYNNHTFQTLAPPTPMSLRPATQAKPPHSTVQSRRVDSVRSVSASLHSTALPTPPQVAALPRHPRLGGTPEANMSRAGWFADAQDYDRSVASPFPAMTPLSASTFGSQTVPADIPEWFTSIHNTRII